MDEDLGKIILLFSGIAAVVGFIVGVNISSFLSGIIAAFATLIMLLNFRFGNYGHSNEQAEGYNYKTSASSRFTRTYLALVVHVIQQSEKEEVERKTEKLKEHLKTTFQQYHARDLWRRAKKRLESGKPLNVNKLYSTFVHRPHRERIQLLYQLFRIVVADENLSEKEEAFLKELAKNLKISDKNYQRIRAMFIEEEEETETAYEQYYQQAQQRRVFVPSLSASYSVLGVDENVTENELKRAYRSLAKEHHPDMFSHLSESVQQDAAEKFIKIKNAYDRIYQYKDF